MSGHMGAERVTVQSLEVVRVDAERNLLLVKALFLARLAVTWLCASSS